MFIVEPYVSFIRCHICYMYVKKNNLPEYLYFDKKCNL